MRRILVVINNSGVGGAERRLGRIFARLADEDPHTVLLVDRALWARLRAAGCVTGRERRIRRLPGPWGAMADWLGWRTGPLGFWLRKVDYAWFACLLTARYALAPPALFHVALGGAYAILPLMWLRPSHRVLVSVTNPSLEQMVGHGVGVPLYGAALARCARVDALTERVRARLIARGIDPRKIAVPPGSVVDAQRFRPAEEKEPWVVFAGRLVEDKNPLLFVEAVPMIRAAVPEARFSLFGEGPLAEGVRATAARLRIEEVLETGFRPDLHEVLARARVFVSLQREDNYPSQSLLEAMSGGLAVVATDVGLTWQLVDEETGLRVKPDPEEVAQAVIALLRDPDRCARLGRAARARALSRHSETGYRAYLDAQYAALGRCGA